ncbi:uncharacterized protein [Typha angustifolia]|uniref:uncharacterized protein n=1 Tax=Typha angustifolia TaxID=59011 RepID=UPI003C2FE0D9
MMLEIYAGDNVKGNVGEIDVVDGFKTGCKPYLGLDGYYLNGKYFGDLLATTACDANYGIFPVAFAVINIETRDFVKAQNEKTWTRSEYQEGAKVHYYTNCGAESFNKFILEDRAKSYTDLIDSIRQKLMVKMGHRIRHAEMWQDKLTLVLAKYVQWVSKEAGGAGSIFRSGNEETKVKGENERCTVKLDEQTCSCRRWQLCGFPCIHAAAVILSFCRKVADYVNDCFTIETI